MKSSETYTMLKDEVRTFVVAFHKHIVEQNVLEIENDYQIKFPKLTEQYFSSTRWPSAEVITQFVDGDSLFLLLYKELYYRHLYAHVSSGLSVEDMLQSYLNYCALFNQLIKSDKPLNLALPNQWLWDIVDEFLYQFQRFTFFRNRPKQKSEDEVVIRQNPRMWSIYSVLNVLFSLVEKSSINILLSYYASKGDPDEIADDFGRSGLYKMFGFFSLIGLCRLHCLLGDYYTALKVLENININRLDMYHEVPTCHITTGNYVGLALMMMRRYPEAVRIFSNTLAYKNRVMGTFAQRSDLREYVNKQGDQMSCLYALCLTMSPMSVDPTMEGDRRDKASETFLRLQQPEEAEFSSSFDFGCPRFISPEMPNYARVPVGGTGSTTDPLTTGYVLEPQRQQMDLFRQESLQHINLLQLRSFLKLYINIPTAKLATFLNTSELAIHHLLMAFKLRLKQATSCSLANADNLIDVVDAVETQQQSQQHHLYPAIDFYVDGNMTFISDTTMEPPFSKYFARQITMLQQMNPALDSLERYLHDTNAVEANGFHFQRR